MQLSDTNAFVETDIVIAICNKTALLVYHIECYKMSSQDLMKFVFFLIKDILNRVCGNEEYNDLV